MESSKESRLLWGSTVAVGRLRGGLMCWKFEESHMAHLDICFTIVLEGDAVTFYSTTGLPWHSRNGKIKLMSGNPKGL